MEQQLLACAAAYPNLTGFIIGIICGFALVAIIVWQEFVGLQEGRRGPRL